MKSSLALSVLLVAVASTACTVPAEGGPEGEEALATQSEELTYFPIPLPPLVFYPAWYQACAGGVAPTVVRVTRTGTCSGIVTESGSWIGQTVFTVSKLTSKPRVCKYTWVPEAGTNASPNYFALDAVAQKVTAQAFDGSTETVTLAKVQCEATTCPAGTSMQYGACVGEAVAYKTSGWIIKPINSMPGCSACGLVSGGGIYLDLNATYPAWVVQGTNVIVRPPAGATNVYVPLDTSTVGLSSGTIVSLGLAPSTYY